MRREEAWLGICHLYEGEGDATVDYRAYAAVWCADREGFDEVLRAHLAGRPLQLLWSEEVYPAVQWYARFPRERAAVALARNVHPKEVVALGTIQPLEARTSPDRVKTIEGVEPLDAQFGVWPKKNVPDALREPLFGQPSPTESDIERYSSLGTIPRMRTFALFDAGNALLFPELLAASGLRYRCLFKGDAEAGLKNIAPYVAELEEGSIFTRRLFTHSGMPGDMWANETGFYIRSRDDLDQIWRHFRKFTRLQDETGKWLFFRFWERSIRPSFLRPREEGSLFAKLIGHHGLLLRSRGDRTIYHEVRRS